MRMPEETYKTCTSACRELTNLTNHLLYAAANFQRANGWLAAKFAVAFRRLLAILAGRHSLRRDFRGFLGARASEDLLNIGGALTSQRSI